MIELVVFVGMAALLYAGYRLRRHLAGLRTRASDTSAAVPPRRTFDAEEQDQTANAGIEADTTSARTARGGIDEHSGVPSPEPPPTQTATERVSQQAEYIEHGEDNESLRAGADASNSPVLGLVAIPPAPTAPITALPSADKTGSAAGAPDQSGELIGTDAVQHAVRTVPPVDSLSRSATMRVVDVVGDNLSHDLSEAAPSDPEELQSPVGALPVGPASDAPSDDLANADRQSSDDAATAGVAAAASSPELTDGVATSDLAPESQSREARLDQPQAQFSPGDTQREEGEVASSAKIDNPAQQPPAPPARPIAPRQYRPARRTPATTRAPRSATVSADRRGPQRLSIEVRLLHRPAAGLYRISLLAQRTAELPDYVTIRGTESVGYLRALQEDWFETVAPDGLGDALRHGVAWQATNLDGTDIEWALSGREIYVLLSGRHDLGGFVTAPRLILGGDHIVLCTRNRRHDVLGALTLAGCQEAVELEKDAGLPAQWVGFKSVHPRVPIISGRDGSILDVLRPLADIEIVLEGGIRFERSTWLIGHPPAIRLRGDTSLATPLLIDEKPATLQSDGRYEVPGWDAAGHHTVWYGNTGRTYRIAAGLQQWSPWPAHVLPSGERAGERDTTRGIVCGAVVLPPSGSPPSARGVVVSARDAVLLGARPGEICVCLANSDPRTSTCIGWPAFEPVWAIPRHPLRCDKRSARVILIGAAKDAVAIRQFSLRQRRDLQEWSRLILDAQRRGLDLSAQNDAAIGLWARYKVVARQIWRRLR